MLTLAGIWSLQHMPLDALPDILHAQVVVNTNWMCSLQIFKDQLTYPIVATVST